ncbi:ABC transporter substrate-binding protein [Streptococcus sp. zg-JUN1979]|uniref:ABC transporter substrate-binding protein n=1 Tax=Streptococcus sp. zg-JUN1979 TaxID=3391450 RepID=UPI0039A5AAA2
MSQKSKWLATAGVTLLAVSALAACSNQKTSSSNNKDTLPTSVTNEGTVKEDATLNVAVVDDSGGVGIVMPELPGASVDSDLAEYAYEFMFTSDENLQISDTGLATATIDEDKKTVTVSLTGKDYKWSDGQPFTIDDYIFAIEKIGDKDYTGIRYNEGFSSIVGMADYHDGKTDTISGIEKKDDYTVVLQYEDINPSMTYVSYLPMYAVPKHIFQDIPVKDWEQSEYAREKYVGMGPYKIKEIVPGESIVYEANPYYYRGEAKIKHVKKDLVSTDTIASEVKAGHYDIVSSMPSDQYDQFQTFTNVDILASKSNTFHYMGFKLGKVENDKFVRLTDAKVADVNLRQALAYALDNEQLGQTVYNGFWTPATTLEISFFGDLHDKKAKGYPYDPEKAKELLEEAGYKDSDNDGYVETPKGDKLTLTLAAPQRGDAFESMIQQYIEWWKQIGVKVELFNGRTMEKNAFYEEIEKNDTKVDMFLGAVGTGFDPSPIGLWGSSPTSTINKTGFASEEQDKLFAKLVSPEAMDEDYRIKAYAEWQEYANKQLYAAPLFEISEGVVVNKRVKYYETAIGSEKARIENLELVEDKGIADK